MRQLAELRERVTRLEERVDDVHNLASGTDREVAEWRTTLNNHTNTLNAMSEQLNDRFDKVDDRFAKVDERFDKMDDRFTKVDERFDKLEFEMREGFTKVGLGMAQITALLTTHLDGPDKETHVSGADE